MKKINLILAILVFGGISFTITSCKKHTPDVPDDVSKYDPNLKCNSTIKAIKDSLGSSVMPYQFMSDVVVYGIVTADDKSGNFYKTIMIQDSTAGIPLLIERSSLYVDYPVGRKIYIKLKGMYVGIYHGMKQIGYALDQTNNAVAGIPASLVNQYIVKADIGHTLPIKSFTLAQLNANINNEAITGSIIKIDSGAEFASSALNLSYSQPSGNASATNRSVEQCLNGTIIGSMDLRTSAYANFQPNIVPAGRGSLIAIFSRYDSYKQLAIRDESDVQFNDVIRCDGTTPTPPTPMLIKDLRNLYIGSTATNGVVLGNYRIHGTIISSIADSNTTSGSYFLQDESGRGINMFALGTSYNIGDSVTVDVSGDSLIVYKGNLEIKKGASATLIINQISSGKSVTPTTVTAASLLADLTIANYKDRQYECTLVKIANGTISGGPTYGGTGINNTLTDATGNITIYCANKKPYNITAIPTGAKTVTGIGANYNTTAQILPRKLSDIQ